MRKLFAVAFCLVMSSSLLLAVPAGPGGTIYVSNIGSSDYGGPTLSFYYVDVDSNWDPITPGAACVFIATVNNNPGYTSYRNSWGNPNIWTPGTGYHTAELMTGAYYNNNSNGTLPWGEEGNEAADLVKIQTNGTVSLISDGVAGGYGVPSTTGLTNASVVDNAFMPAVSAPGDPNRGVLGVTFWQARVWQDQDGDSLYEEQGVASEAKMDSYDQEYVPGYGLVSSSYDSIRLTTWNGTKYSSTVVMNDENLSHSYPMSAAGMVAAADVDNDGLLDYYYMDTRRKLIHAEDWDLDGNLNGAGDAYVIYDENTESPENQMRGMGDNGDLELVQPTFPR